MSGSGEDGQKAAQDTKAAMGKAQDTGEGIRKNINAFADELMGGKSHESTGISSDARMAAETVASAAGKAAGEAEEVADQNKKK